MIQFFHKLEYTAAEDVRLKWADLSAGRCALADDDAFWRIVCTHGLIAMECEDSMDDGRRKTETKISAKTSSRLFQKGRPCLFRLTDTAGNTYLIGTADVLPLVTQRDSRSDSPTERSGCVMTISSCILPLQISQ